MYTYHLVQLPFFTALRVLIFPINSKKIAGMVHAETMTVMKLGSAIYAPTRFFSRELALFIQWENESAFTDFMEKHPIGKRLCGGWYITLGFLRQWGSISGFQVTPNGILDAWEDKPVVAVTVARMKYSQIPRFLRWGRPVEKLVRDHPGTILSLASIRYPNIISTFSIWKTAQFMTDMVHGHSRVPQPKRHHDAMKERDRKDFHFEFTTLRFCPLAERGSWKGQCQFIHLIPDEK